MPPQGALAETRYARAAGGYVAYQVFGQGPPNCLFVGNWLQNLDLMWEEPTIARYFGRLASFSRVIVFDKRGSGVSDPVPMEALPTLEEWMDDGRVSLDAAGVDRVALLGDTDGGPMAIMLAAAYPERVSALILVNSYARWRRDDDYPIGMPEETWHKLLDRYEQHWGVTSEILGLTAPSVANDTRFRNWFVRYQRLSMPRGAAAAMYRWATSLDVRSVLPSIRVPTLVIHRASSPHYRTAFGRYLADSIPGARYVEVPGADAFPFNAGDYDPILDEVEHFLTGTRTEPVLNRSVATILFTDIVGSTGIAVSRGDASWVEILRLHDEIVRDHLVRYQGREVSYTGDGFMAVFDGPGRAAACAVQLVTALRDTGVTVRVGLHTGEVELVGDQIAGLAVHIAARVMAAAPEGGIMVSSTVHDLVMGSGIAFEDGGIHALKGVPGSWQLYRLVEVPGQTRSRPPTT